MKIFNTEQIRLIDKYTINKEPVKSIDLMERAAMACYDWIINKYNTDTNFKIFIGPGNNGGDGLAIARLLADNNYNAEVYIVNISCNYSDDYKINFSRLEEQNKVNISTISFVCDLPVVYPNDVIIDAIFGSGLSKPVDGLAANVIHLLNKCDNTIISIDIPSGLYAEDNRKNKLKNIISANYVLTFQFPKLTFMFPESSKYVDDFNVLDIGLHKKIIKDMETNNYYTTINDIKPLLIKRDKFAHKGNFGHALLIAGSYGKMGAAVLASKSCLRTGVGLLTTHIPKSGYDIIQISTPETMVSIDENANYFTGATDIDKYNAIGVGCGIGTDGKTQNALYDLISDAIVPMVIDADAINILGINKSLIDILPADSILTPHIKEFERIAGKAKNDYERHQLLIEFAVKYKVYVVLKGAHTAIATPNGKCYFNSTGNVGMATAGSGDVLTGIILSLLAQGYNSLNAAIFGVYLHGLSGDIALEKRGAEALIASDIIEHISEGYKKIINYKFFTL